MEPYGVRVGGYWTDPREISGGQYATADTADGESKSCNESESVLVGDARFSGESVALGYALEALPKATFEPDHHTVSTSGERALYVFVAGASREAVTDALMLDPTVVTSECVGTFPDALLYRISLVDDAILVGPTILELGARTLSTRGTEGVWKARLQFADRDSLVTLRQFCTERNVRFGLDSLYQTDRFDQRASDITDQQWETLQAALEGGYYDIPRKETQSDLASKLDISTTAVSYRLRRATAQLVRETLGHSNGPEPKHD